MSPGGQVGLSLALSWRSPRIADLIDGLRQPAVKEKEGIPDEIDNSKFDRRLFFSVAKTPLSRPGDRIESLRLVVNLPEGSPAEFTSVNRYETRYEMADLGKVTGKQTSSASLTAGVGPFTSPTTLPLQASGTLQQGRELSEEVVLRQRYEAFSAQIGDDGRRLVVYEEGVVGIDLTGTFTVDVALKAPRMNGFSVLKHEPLFKDRVPVEPGTFDFKFVRVYSPSDPITATLAGTYRLRRVGQGAESVVEGDDDVEFIDGTFGSCRVTLVPSAEIFNRMATAGVEVRRGTGYLPVEVARRVEDDDSYPLEFFTVPEARRFVDWVHAKAGNDRLSDTYRLFVRDGRKLTALTGDEIDTMRVGAGSAVRAREGQDTQGNP